MSPCKAESFFGNSNMLGWFNSKQYPEFKWDRIVWIPLVWVGQCFMNSNVTWVVISQIILYPSNNIWSIPGEEGRQEFSRLLQVLGEQGWLAMVASCSQTCDRLSVHPNLSLMWCCWNLVSKVCIFLPTTGFQHVSNDQWTIGSWGVFLCHPLPL